jgi:hypothetical protein
MAGIPNPLVNPANPGSWSNDPTANNQGGATAQYSNTSATTAATTETVTLTTSGTVRNKYYATLTLAEPLNAAIETKIDVTTIQPIGYRKTGVMITGISDTFPYSVTYEVDSALGAQTAPGTVLVSGTRFNTGDYGMVKTGRTGLMTDRTQANVQTFYKDQNTLLGTRRGQLFEGLDPNLPFPVALVKAFGETLIQGAINAVASVAEVLNIVGDWISSAIDSAGKIVGKITTAVVDAAENTVEDFLDMLHWVLGGGLASEFQKLTSGHKSVGDVGKQAEELKTVVYQTDLESGTTTDFFNAVRVLPTWVGGKTDDVNLPHSFISGTTTTVATSPSVLGLDGRLVLIPVVAGQNRTWSAVKFGIAALGTGVVPAVTSFNMAVYDVDEITGAATKVIDLGNVKSKINVGANSNRDLQVISLPSPKLVQMGEIYYIGILQIGTPLALSSAPTSVIPYSFSTGTFPKRVSLYYNAGTLGVTPASIADAQTSGTSSNFWGAFGDDVPNVVQPTVAFADNFTGTSGAVIDTQKWLTRYGNGLRIASGPGGELRATANSTNGTSINTYKFKTNYLKQTAQCTIVTQTENLGRLGVGGGIIILRGDGNGKFIYLRVVIEVFGLSWRLKVGIYTSLTYSQPGTQLSGGTLRKEVTLNTGLNPSNGNTWKFLADGYTYVGYRNNVEFIRWEDTGFAFAGSGAANANFKEVGIGAFYASEYSCVDNWTVSDQSV